MLRRVRGHGRHSIWKVDAKPTEPFRRVLHWCKRRRGRNSTPQRTLGPHKIHSVEIDDTQCVLVGESRAHHIAVEQDAGRAAVVVEP
jgi:hypothetical protein